jgi:hypothetical protein
MREASLRHVDPALSEAGGRRGASGSGQSCSCGRFSSWEYGQPDTTKEKRPCTFQLPRTARQRCPSRGPGCGEHLVCLRRLSLPKGSCCSTSKAEKKLIRSRSRRRPRRITASSALWSDVSIGSHCRTISRSCEIGLASAAGSGNREQFASIVSRMHSGQHRRAGSGDPFPSAGWWDPAMSSCGLRVSTGTSCVTTPTWQANCYGDRPRQPAPAVRRPRRIQCRPTCPGCLQRRYRASCRLDRQALRRRRFPRHSDRSSTPVGSRNSRESRAQGRGRSP